MTWCWRGNLSRIKVPRARWGTEMDRRTSIQGSEFTPLKFIGNCL